MHVNWFKKNDIIWTNPISFVASANCALYCGAKVDYIDIDLNTFNVTFENFKKKIESTKKKFTKNINSR